MLKAVQTRKRDQKQKAKMSQRLKLWAQNFASRLGEMGYNEEQLNERFEKMFEDEVDE